LYVAPIDPTQFLQRQPERADPGLIVRIVRGCAQKYADTPHLLALLPPRRERPCGHRPTEKRYELAPSHLLPPSGQRSVAAQNNTGNGRPMSALGQKQTCAVQNGMSALPPIATVKADIVRRCPPDQDFVMPEERKCANIQ
jgi:hypothetical protein